VFITQQGPHLHLDVVALLDPVAHQASQIANLPRQITDAQLHRVLHGAQTWHDLI
jgi:hypothetical protein